MVRVRVMVVVVVDDDDDDDGDVDGESLHKRILLCNDLWQAGDEWRPWLWDKGR